MDIISPLTLDNEKDRENFKFILHNNEIYCRKYQGVMNVHVSGKSRGRKYVCVRVTDEQLFYLMYPHRNISSLGNLVYFTPHDQFTRQNFVHCHRYPDNIKNVFDRRITKRMRLMYRTFQHELLQRQQDAIDKKKAKLMEEDILDFFDDELL